MTPTAGAIRRTLLCAVAALVVPAIAACGGVSGGAADSSSSSPSPSSSPPPSPSGSASPGGASSGSAASAVLVTYRRQGGIAGVDDSLVVHGDGSYQVSHRGAAPTTGTLSPAQLAAVRQAVAGAHLADLPASSRSTGTADMFVYRLGDGNREVQVDQASVPPAAVPLLTTLNGIAGG